MMKKKYFLFVLFCIIVVDVAVIELNWLSVCVCHRVHLILYVCGVDGFAGLCLRILIHEWILNRFHAILRTNQNNGCATAHNQSQATCIFGHFVCLFGVAQIFLCVVQHQIQQRIITFKYAACFTATGKFHTDCFFQIFTEIQNRFLPAFFFVFTLVPTAAGLLTIKKRIENVY